MLLGPAGGTQETTKCGPDQRLAESDLLGTRIGGASDGEVWPVGPIA
jgi:hypothetical protein